MIQGLCWREKGEKKTKQMEKTPTKVNRQLSKCVHLSFKKALLELWRDYWMDLWHGAENTSKYKAYKLWELGDTLNQFNKTGSRGDVFTTSTKVKTDNGFKLCVVQGFVFTVTDPGLEV